MFARLPDIINARTALGLALLLAWLNFLLTAKWAYIPGALHGWKQPWYAAILVAATVLFLGALRNRHSPGPVLLNITALRVLVAAAWMVLIGGLIVVLPPSLWSQIPFDDDWVPRYKATIDGVQLLREGAAVGWQWAMLGGHQTSADLSQSLTVVGAIPMLLFGDQIGYHLLHVIVLAGIPILVYRDIASDGRRDVALLTSVFVTICAIGMFGTIMPSGDTNSIAGVFAAMVALTGSRLAHTGHRWGSTVLVVGLTLAAYAHTAFLVYTGLYLLLEAAFYRDWRIAARAAVAGLVAGIAALPQYVELLQYPDYFITNNLIYAPGAIDWSRVARKIFYNIEILLHPHRWFNDYLSLANVLWALIAWVALQPGTSRPRFHAWMVLLTIGLLRLDVPEAGYLLTRQMHMLAAIIAAPLAAFVILHVGHRWLAWTLVLLVVLYPYANFNQVPHVTSPREFDPVLVDRLATRDGNLVLLENSPHRDLDSDPDRRTERTPWGIHFEALVADTAGVRLYGQMWDCWHWSPFRGQVVAGGSFRGEIISATPIEEFVDEMRTWGVRHLLVWSAPTIAYLDNAPAHFARRWTHDRWVEFELLDADPRAVVADHAEGDLENLHLLGGDIRLQGAHAGEQVVVRMNYFPAWRARVGDTPLSLSAVNGQLAFTAPVDGDYVVSLEYPRRRPLLLGAVLALFAGALVLTFGAWFRPPARSA